MREDDSCAPHFSPTLCQYNRLDRLVWEGLGFLLSLSSILNKFERSFIYLFIYFSVIWGEEAFQLFNLFPNLPFALFYPPPF